MNKTHKLTQWKKTGSQQHSIKLNKKFRETASIPEKQLAILEDGKMFRHLRGPALSAAAKKFTVDLMAAAPYSLDMVTTSPVLAVLAFHPNYRPPKGYTRLKRTLQAGIKNGESAKALHKKAGIPWPFRKLPINTAIKLLLHGNEIPVEVITAYFPESPDEQESWTRFMVKVMNASFFMSFRCARADNLLPLDFRLWMLKQGSPELDAYGIHALTPLLDWYEYSIMGGDRTDPGYEAIDKHWSDKMTLQSATEEHNLWADRLNMIRSPYHEFPAPWYPRIKLSGGYYLFPITDSAKLLEEGQKMRHCVSAYTDNVIRGICYIYSLRKDGKRALTVELQRDHVTGYYCRVAQALGLRNRRPDNSERKAVAEVRDYLKNTPTFL